MTRSRVVVGAFAEDDTPVRLAARVLRDAGHEVVLVGGGQTPEQLARTAVAEDATRVVVDDVGPAADELTSLLADDEVSVDVAADVVARLGGSG